MALLQKVRILANERLDKPDFDNIQEFVCADLQAIKKHIFTSENFVVAGFTASGVSTNQLTIPLAGSTAIYGSNNGALYIGAASLTALTSTTLTPSATNYVEIVLSTDTGGADSRAFWDQTAQGGLGGEFSQIVDTFTFTKADIIANTSSFSGDVAKLPICEVDVSAGGIITAIRDSRNMFFRLGRRTDTSFTYPWATRVEPTVTSFTGADKDIANLKEWADAIMSIIKEVKGTTHWYEQSPVDLQGGFRSTGLSILSAATASSRFAWDGTKLSITDDNGSPADSDTLAYIRSFDITTTIALTRQDGVNAITIADGQVVWVELPNPVGTNISFDGVGLTNSNYRVSARGSVPLDSNVYWLAYREGTQLYLRGLGQLEAGEAREINDETPAALKAFLGFDPEIATSVPYSFFPNLTYVPYTFTSTSTLVHAISVNAENIDYLAQLLQKNVYDEPLLIVSGAPIDDNQATGPISVSGFLTLPLDSRAANTPKLYIVGAAQLEVYMNGVLQMSGRDYTEVGAPATLSTQIQVLKTLDIGDEIHFRLGVIGGISTVGGSSETLQDAYDLGNIITTTYNRPMILQGGGTLGTDEIQTISFSGVVPEFGNIIYSLGGNPSTSIAYNANAAAVQSALNSITGVSGVSVSGSYASDFIVTFGGASGKIDQPMLTVTTDTLYDFPFFAAPNETFRATYNPTLATLLANPLSAEYSAGSPDPIIVVGSPVSTSLVDIAGTGIKYTFGAATYSEYSDPSANPSSSGTLRFKFQFPIIATPSANNSLVTLTNSTAVDTIKVTVNTSTGVITAVIKDELGTTVATLTTTGTVPAATTKEVEVNWNYATGSYALFVNGIAYSTSFVSAIGAAVARTPSVIKAGNIYGTNSDYVIVDDIQLFDVIIHPTTVSGSIFTGEVPRFIEAVLVTPSITETVKGVPNNLSKVAEFYGDIKVTGLIDPAGIIFDPQLMDPTQLADDGLYVSSSHDLIQRRGNSLPDINLTQAALTALPGSVTAVSVEVTLDNNTGTTITKATPVRVDINGDIAKIDVSDESQAFAAFAVVNEDILDGASGTITQSGKLTDITTSAVFGDVVFVSKTGDLTNVKPTIGVGGFLAGDFIVRVGIISKNRTTPSLKDLLINITVVGQL